MIQAVQTSPPFERGEVRRFEYPNGATLVAHPSSQAMGCNVLIWFAAGPRYEKASNQGIAHLIEHLLFKASYHLEHPHKSLIKRLENLGAEFNAFTAKESVSFELDCLGERLGEVLPLFLELCLAPTFRQEDLQKEKQVIAQELREDRDDEETMAEEKFFQKAYPFALGHPIGGGISQVKKLTLKQVKHFYQKYFSVNRMVIAISGGIRPEEVAKSCGTFFAKWSLSGKAKPVRPQLKRHYFHFSPFTTSLKRPSENTAMIVGGPGASISHPLRGASVLLDYYLTGGMSSRLFHSLRMRQGLVYDVSSSATGFSDCGSFEVTALCAPKLTKQVHGEILRELEKTYQRPDLGKDLEELKRQLYDSWAMAYDMMAERNYHLATSEFYWGGPRTLEQAAQRVMQASEKEVRQVLSDLLASASLVTVGGPRRRTKGNK